MMRGTAANWRRGPCQVFDCATQGGDMLRISVFITIIRRRSNQLLFSCERSDDSVECLSDPAALKL